MRSILVPILLAAILLALVPGTVRAQVPIGWHAYDVQGCGANQMQLDEVIRFYQRSQSTLIKIFLGPWGCVEPVAIDRLLSETPIRTIVLRTDDGPGGYDYHLVRHQVESPRAGGRSWADAMRAHPEIDWWIEVGNEPNHWPSFDDPWPVRWWGLALYKELALNSVGHIDQAWRQKYPMLRWAFSMNVGGAGAYDAVSYARVLTMWLQGQGLGDGGVLDYYDAVGIHLYGPWSLRDWGMTHTHVESVILQNPYHDLILYSEVGIWEGNDAAKVAAYREFLTSQAPQETAGIVVWLLGRGTSWPEFEVDDGNVGRGLLP